MTDYNSLKRDTPAITGDSGFLTKPDSSAGELNREELARVTPKIDEVSSNVHGPAHIGSLKSEPVKNTEGGSPVSVPSQFSKQGPSM